MLLNKARQISGFTYDTELEWLAAAASGRNRIAEIGCWKGRSTRAMADNSEGIIMAIDTWEGTKEDGHYKEFEGKPHGWLYKEFCDNLLDHIKTARVIPLRVQSVLAAQMFAKSKQTFDMIFVDAAHDYQSVKDDIEAWYPLLMPGGLFCGHDADRDGVVKAIEETGVQKKVGIGSLWTMQK